MPRLLLLALALPALLAAPAARAQCFAELEIRDAQDRPTLAPLQLRLTDREGGRHAAELPAGATTFVFERVACGAVALDVLHRSGPGVEPAEENYLLRRTFTLDPTGANRFEVEVPALQKIRARAVDGEGRPVPGGAIRLIHGGAFSSRNRTVRLGDDGAAEVVVLPSDWTVQYRRMEFELSGPSRVLDEPGGEVLLFVHPEPQDAPPSVSATVVDPEGNPLSGVAIRMPPRTIRKLSGPDGRFSIDVDPESLPRTFEAFDPLGRWTFETRTLGPEALDEPQVWTARPWPGPRVRLRVEDRDLGEPIVGAGWIAQSDCGGDEREALFYRLRGETGEEGWADLPCDSRCALQVSVGGVRSHRGAWEASRRNRIPPEACGERWTVELERATAVGGVVVDEFDLPIVGLPLELTDEAGGRRAGAVSDAEGGYVFASLDPGRYRVRVAPDDARQANGGMYLSDPGARRILAPASVAEREFVRRDAVARPAGRVCFEGIRSPDATVDPEAPPLVPLWTRLIPSGEDEGPASGDRQLQVLGEIAGAGGAGTDGAGCLPGVPPGDWHVGIVASWGDERSQAIAAPPWSPRPATRSRARPTHEVVEGETVRIPLLEGQPSGALGLMLTDVDARDVVRARLELRPADAGGGSGGAGWVEVPDDRFFPAASPAESAGVVIALIPPGTYDVRVRIPENDDRPRSLWIAADPVRVDAGGRDLIELERD